uniref:UDP-glucuronosyltransferase n=1 Tax=Zygaena filipendulae TaxID=287375 RepID=A0A286MXP2_9NEOP|nr:UDP-glycosyltransferase UGT33U1 [Zygaena filipendulae]
MALKLSKILILVSCSIILCDSARILCLFPTSSFSHQSVFRALTHELARRGHDVVVITPNPAFPKGQTPDNLTEIDIHDELSFTIETWNKAMRQHGLQDYLAAEDKYVKTMQIVYKQMTETFEALANNEEVQKIFKDNKKKIDLLILEAWPRPLLVLSHIFKVPVIQISSFGTMVRNYETVGAIGNPLLLPTGLRLRVHNMTIWEKFVELYNYITLTNFYDSYEETDNAMLRKLFGPDVPPLSELANNVDMLFLNVNPIWNGNWPAPPSVVHLGGLHLELYEPKPLPKDLQTYLDNSHNGAIYVSFGTNIAPSAMSLDRLSTFIDAFAKLPYNVLFKYDQESLPMKQPENVMISKWFPQADVLNHTNIKLFICQGGLQSTDEALMNGVPLIGIPMLGDQWFNTEKYEHHRIGKKLDFNTVTEEELLNSIETVIKDET